MTVDAALAALAGFDDGAGEFGWEVLTAEERLRPAAGTDADAVIIARRPSPGPRAELGSSEWPPRRRLTGPG